ncbi:hypothetical protein DFR70_108279 [Nocardia tenerifensis]|uniref:Uncharacterized protein n=1 Tax=Nocardia tenerifensis TaxID=228006 RepID=A0A318K163_9NOCA|nr:hypothetical protein [Nocardia tenerifensis]PXX61721.1 hypothetical protein DFR70_108279 [Nocardia tenerifensis]
MRNTEFSSTAQRAGGRAGAARRASSRTSAEEALARVRAERAQLEQGRLFRATLLEEAEQLHEELGALHEELREIYRQLSGLRKRFPSLPPAPRMAGYPPMALAPMPANNARTAAPQATA